MNSRLPPQAVLSAGYDLIDTQTGNVTLRDVNLGGAMSAGNAYNRNQTPAHRFQVFPTGTYVHERAAPVNAVLHVPAHKQTRPGAAPAQIVDTEWHALARIAA